MQRSRPHRHGRKLTLFAAALVGTAAGGVLIAVPAIADGNINVPCTGPVGATGPAAGGPAGLIAAVNLANTRTGNTEIDLAPGCDYAFTSPFETDDGSGV